MKSCKYAIPLILALCAYCSCRNEKQLIPIASFDPSQVNPNAVFDLLKEKGIESSIEGSTVYQISVMEKKVDKAIDVLRKADFFKNLNIYPRNQ